MRIIRPATVPLTGLLATNATETVPAYNNGTTYAAAALVRSDATGRIYQSLQAGNLNHALTDPVWWVDVLPTNKWAAFDAVNGTETVGAAGLDMTFQPDGRVDSIALLNVKASTARIIITVDSVVLFDVTRSLISTDGVIDALTYCYEPIVYETDLVELDIPTAAAPTIRIILSAGGGAASVGTIVCGQARVLGTSSYGAGLGIIDYSRKTVDDFGNYQVVQRAFSRKASFRVQITAEMVNEVFRLLSLYRATPLLYIGATLYSASFVFGFYKDFNVEIAYPSHSIVTIELEGLT